MLLKSLMLMLRFGGGDADSAIVHRLWMLDDLVKDVHKFDTVISITVLQHILDDTELEATLKMLHGKMAESGLFIVMESFLDHNSDYIRRWSKDDLISYFERAGFQLSKGYDFYKDGMQNEQDYKKFRNLEVKILDRLYEHLPETAKRNAFRRYKKRMQKIMVEGRSRKYLSELTDSFGYKFFVFRKKGCEG